MVIYHVLEKMRIRIIDYLWYFCCGRNKRVETWQITWEDAIPIIFMPGDDDGSPLCSDKINNFFVLILINYVSQNIDMLLITK